MKKFAFALGALATVATVFAADTYTWKTAADGNWSEAANWTSGTGTAYPNNGDTVGNMAWGGYTVTLTEAITLAQLSPQKGGGIITFDLNGQSLTLTLGNNSYFPQGGTLPTAPGQEAYTVGSLFKDGTMSCNGISLGSMGQGSGGFAVMDLSNVALSAFVNSWSGPSRMILRDGTVWTATKATRIEPGLWHQALDTRYPCLIVKGTGTQISSADYDVIVGSYDGGLYLKDSATATFKDVNVGGSFRSTNAVASVENATLTAVGTLRVGTDDTNPTEGGTGTIRCDYAMGHSATLKIGGAQAKVTAAALEVYEATDAALAFDVPATGYAAVPLEADTFALKPRVLEPVAGFGPTHLNIACYNWAQAHGEETETLIRLETGNAAALATLAGYVVWTDYPADMIAAGKVPTLSVSSDGTELRLTAPAVNLKPVFELTASASALAGEKQMVLNLTDYGYGASTLTAIDCMYADNADFTGASTTNFLAGLSPVSSAVPCELTYRLNGGFVQYGAYWAKVRVTNGNGQYDERTMAFTADGVAEDFKWPDPVDGNFSDVTKWTVGGNPAQSYPHAEDTVEWKANAMVPYVVSFTGDAAVSYFKNYSTYSHSPIVFELGGHALTFNDTRAGTVFTVQLSSSEIGGANTNWNSSTMCFRNGTVTIPTAIVAGSAPGLALGAGEFGAATKQCGTLVLEDGMSFTANLKYFMNSSRILIRGGSAYHVINQGVMMQNHTANYGNGRILVTDANSLLDVKTYDFTVRGDCAVVEILNGGKVIANNLLVGSNSTLSGTGTVASDLTQVRFENGTAQLSGGIELGWTSDLKCNARLDLAGTNASVAATGALTIHEGLASVLGFEVPVDGYRTCPLTVGDLAFVAKPDGNTDFGATRLAITMKLWMKAHPGASLDLVTLATPNPSALERLKACAAFADVSTGNYASHAFLRVSDDGTKLILQAPPRRGLTVRIR